MSAFSLLLGILLVLAFLTAAGGVTAIIAFSIVRKRKNDRSFRITVDASVLAKYTSIQRHPVAGDASGAHGYTTFTSYHVTFLAANGAQMPLDVDRATFESLIEGERGRLTCQGTRYLGFVPYA